MILLDTHVWVWWVHAGPRLPANYAQHIQQREPEGLGFITVRSSLWTKAFAPMLMFCSPRKRKQARVAALATLGVAGFVPSLAGCSLVRGQGASSSARLAGARALAPASDAPGLRIARAARAQVGDVYDPAYAVLTYPGGDVARGRGACTDVVIRALRAGAGVDLQRLVHEDMRRNWGQYPRKWGLARPDKNIDHRRVPNLDRFFRRHGAVLTNAPWRAGDLVRWELPSGLDHIGVVSDKTNAATGAPFVIHNLAVCAEEDCLTRWKITGHYRFPVRPARPGARS